MRGQAQDDGITRCPHRRLPFFNTRTGTRCKIADTPPRYFDARTGTRGQHHRPPRPFADRGAEAAQYRRNFPAWILDTGTAQRYSRQSPPCRFDTKAGARGQHHRPLATAAPPFLTQGQMQVIGSPTPALLPRPHRRRLPFLTQGRLQDTDEIFPLHTTAWNGTIKSC